MKKGWDLFFSWSVPQILQETCRRRVQTVTFSRTHQSRKVFPTLIRCCRMVFPGIQCKLNFCSDLYLTDAIAHLLCLKQQTCEQDLLLGNSALVGATNTMKQMVLSFQEWWTGGQGNTLACSSFTPFLWGWTFKIKNKWQEKHQGNSLQLGLCTLYFRKIISRTNLDGEVKKYS